MADTPLQDRVLRCLIARHPNWVPVPILAIEIPDCDEPELSAALAQLESSQRIVSSSQQAHLLYPASVAVRLGREFESLPFARVVKVGDLELPRLLPNDTISQFPEQFNFSIEQLARFSEQLQKSLGDKVVEEQRGYWASIVSMFGLFGSVIALVVTGVRTIPADPTLEFKAILATQIAQLLPLGLLLGLFVVALRAVIPRVTPHTDNSG